MSVWVLLVICAHFSGTAAVTIEMNGKSACELAQINLGVARRDVVATYCIDTGRIR